MAKEPTLPPKSKRAKPSAPPAAANTADVDGDVDAQADEPTVQELLAEILKQVKQLKGILGAMSRTKDKPCEGPADDPQ